jgi:hypothetical protein
MKLQLQLREALVVINVFSTMVFYGDCKDKDTGEGVGGGNCH